jgi:hypothetical protein
VDQRTGCVRLIPSLLFGCASLLIVRAVWISALLVGLAFRAWGQGAASTATEAQPQPRTDGQVPPPTASGYLLRLTYMRLAGMEIESNCAIVYVSGHYHLESSSGSFGGRDGSKIHEAAIDSEKLQGLQQLLNDGDLKALQHGNIPEHSKVTFTELTTLWIPRDKSVQDLRFADVVAEAAGGSHYGSSDKNMKLIRPLQKWVKTELKSDKATLVRGAFANGCAPK